MTRGSIRTPLIGLHEFDHRPLRIAVVCAMGLSGCVGRQTATEAESSTTDGAGAEASDSSTLSTATSSSTVGSGRSTTVRGETGSLTTSSSATSASTSSSTTSVPEPACPHNDWFMCDVAWTCVDGEPCGDNHRFDENGCPRERCDEDQDCAGRQVCRDITACGPKGECFNTLGGCSPAFGEECRCIAGGGCNTDLFYCFPPEEYTCENGEPPE